MDDNSAKFLQKLMPGDILVMTSKTPDVIGATIRWWTRSTVSHGSLYAGDGFLVEAVYSGVREIPWMESEYVGNYVVYAYRRRDVSSDQVARVLAYARSKIGKRYDCLTIVPIALLDALEMVGLEFRDLRNRLDIKDWYYCMELIADAYWSERIRLFDADIDRSMCVPDDVLTHPFCLDKVGEYNPHEHE